MLQSVISHCTRSIMLQDGLLIQRQIVPIKIRCFICDTPARCFIKGESKIIKLTKLCEITAVAIPTGILSMSQI